MNTVETNVTNKITFADVLESIFCFVTIATFLGVIYIFMLAF